MSTVLIFVAAVAALATIGFFMFGYIKFHQLLSEEQARCAKEILTFLEQLERGIMPEHSRYADADDLWKQIQDFRHRFSTTSLDLDSSFIAKLWSYAECASQTRAMADQIRQAPGIQPVHFDFLIDEFRVMQESFADIIGGYALTADKIEMYRSINSRKYVRMLYIQAIERYTTWQAMLTDADFWLMTNEKNEADIGISASQQGQIEMMRLQSSQQTYVF